MLIVPEKEQSGTMQEIPPPCYRCLFEKPITEGMCEPETCEMLDFWLREPDFEWDKHVNKWLMTLELKNIAKNSLKEEF